MKPIRARPMPASEPSRPAWGITFCSQLPTNDRTNFTRPIRTMVAMPRYQVIIAASYSAIPLALKPRKAGPRTARTIPMLDGVSRPNGMAVTLGLLVRLARRKAIQVYIRSPKRTPKAVPGNIFLKTISEGKPKAKIRIPAMNDNTVTLSNISPKKPFISPSVNHSYLKGACRSCSAII